MESFFTTSCMFLYCTMWVAWVVVTTMVSVFTCATAEMDEKIEERKLTTKIDKKNNTVVVTIVDDDRHKMEFELKQLQTQVYVCRKNLKAESDKLHHWQAGKKARVELTNRRLVEAKTKIAQFMRQEKEHATSKTNMQSKINQLRMDLQLKDKIISGLKNIKANPKCETAQKMVILLQKRIRILMETVPKTVSNRSCSAQIKIVESKLINQAYELKSELEALKRHAREPKKDCTVLIKVHKHELERQLSIVIIEMRKIMLSSAVAKKSECQLHVTRTSDYFISLLEKLRQEMNSMHRVDCWDQQQESHSYKHHYDTLKQSQHELYQHLKLANLLLSQCSHGASLYFDNATINMKQVHHTVAELKPEIMQSMQMLQQPQMGKERCSLINSNLMQQLKQLDEQIDLLILASGAKMSSTLCVDKESGHYEKIMLMIEGRDREVAQLNQKLQRCNKQTIKLHNCRDVNIVMNEIDEHIKTLFLVFRDLVSRHHTACKDYSAQIEKVKVELNKMRNKIYMMTIVFVQGHETLHCEQFHNTIAVLKGKSSNLLVENYLLKAKLATCGFEGRRCHLKNSKKCPNCPLNTLDPKGMITILREQFNQCRIRCADNAMKHGCDQGLAEVDYIVQLLASSCQRMGIDNRMLIKIVEKIRANHKLEIAELRRICNGRGNRARNQAQILTLKVWFDMMKSYLQSCESLKPLTDVAQRKIVGASTIYEKVVEKNNAEIYALKWKIASLKQKDACWPRDPFIVKLQSTINALQLEFDLCNRNVHVVGYNNTNRHCRYTCPSTVDIETRLNKVKQQMGHEMKKLLFAKDACDRQLRHLEKSTTDLLPWYKLKEEVENICIQRSFSAKRRRH